MLTVTARLIVAIVRVGTLRCSLTLHYVNCNGAYVCGIPAL